MWCMFPHLALDICVCLLISMLFVSLMAFSAFIYPVHPSDENIPLSSFYAMWRYKGADWIPEVLGEIRNFRLLIQALCCSLSAEMQKVVQDLSEFGMVLLLFCKWNQVPFVPFVFLLYQNCQELREDFNLKESGARHGASESLNGIKTIKDFAQT